MARIIKRSTFTHVIVLNDHMVAKFEATNEERAKMVARAYKRLSGSKNDHGLKLFPIMKSKKKGGD